MGVYNLSRQKTKSADRTAQNCHGDFMQFVCDRTHEPNAIDYLLGGDHRIGEGTSGNETGQKSDPLDCSSLPVSGHLYVERGIGVALLVQDCSSVVKDAFCFGFVCSWVLRFFPE